jgi:uncharacterized damage-inducible protein DinB
MTKDDIKLLYQYNFWANRLILSKAEQVTVEELTQARSYSWESLAGTLVHIMDTEYGWRVFLKEKMTTPVFDVKDYPDVAAIRARWDVEEKAMWDYLDSLSDDDLKHVFSHEDRKYMIWLCLMHVVNHGTQHRSECAVMLTDLGQSPGDIDLTVFLNSL